MPIVSEERKSIATNDNVFEYIRWYRKRTGKKTDL